MGPRQVGKTTMVNQLFKQISTSGMFESADAIAVGNSTWIEQIWETGRLKMKTRSHQEFLLIIDEIQKNPNWSETIKKIWDEDSRNDIPLKVILHSVKFY